MSKVVNMSHLINCIKGYTAKLLWPEKINSPVSRMEAYLSTTHKILTWEDPILSGITLAVLHMLFWLIVQLELRLYSIIFLLLLIALICDVSFEKLGIQAPRSPTSDAMRNSWNVFTNIILYLKTLRRDSPAVFCTYMCAMCISLSIVAKTFSGYTLAYISTLLVFLGPGLVKRLPPEVLAKVRSTIEQIRTNDGVPDENELMPTIMETMDAETNSYVDAEGSLDLDLEDSNDLLDPKQLEQISSSDSDSEHKRELNFSTTHFNGSSSSSASSVDGSSMGGGRGGGGSPPRKHDSDSEFEIIDDNLEFPADTT